MSFDYEEQLERAREKRSRSRKKPERRSSLSGTPSVRQTASRAGSPRHEAGSEPSGRRTARSEAVRAESAGRNGSDRRSTRDAKRKKTRRLIIMAVAECFALLFIFGYAYVAKLWGSIQRPEFKANDVRNQEFAVEKPQYMKGHWTVAVFGVDSRGEAVGKGNNADVNMICDINQDTGEIKLVSVFRDTYLNVSDDNTYNKLNYAYFVGGPEQAVKTLNKNLDLDITDYATFNWKAVADAINILGGIDMEISKSEFYYINSFITETVKATGVPSTHLKKAGMNHLDGVQAVAYGRLRLMDTDYARTERQRKVIQAAFDKAKTADISVLNNILVVVFPQIATSLDFADLYNMATNVTKYYIGETSGFPTARGEQSMGKKGSCVIPQTLESNVKQLHQFLFNEENYEPTNTVKTIGAKISADTGLYKESEHIGHVPTDKGYIPKATTAPATTEARTEEETTEETTIEIETDEDGNLIDPPEDYEIETDEDGNLIPTTSGSGSETRPSRPGSTTAPDESSSAGPGGETSEAETTESYRPQFPGDTGESESETESQAYPGQGGNEQPSRPGETMDQDELDAITGPGVETKPSDSVILSPVTETESSQKPTEALSQTPGESVISPAD